MVSNITHRCAAKHRDELPSPHAFQAQGLQPTTSNGSYCASQQNGVLDFRFGSKADICAATSHVRFTPNSDIDCVFRHVPQGPKADIPPHSIPQKRTFGSAVGMSALSAKLDPWNI